MKKLFQPYALLIFLLFVFSIFLCRSEQSSWSLTWDEKGYISSALDIEAHGVLDTNKEVPPLSKIYMSAFIPKEAIPLALPLSDPIRVDHFRHPMKALDKVSPLLLNELVQSIRMGQCLLHICILLLLGVWAYSSFSRDKWIKTFICFSIIATSTQFMVWNGLAHTEALAMVGLIMALIGGTRIVQSSEKGGETGLDVILFGLGLGIGTLSKGHFFLYGPLFVFSALWAASIHRKSLVQILLGSVIAVAIIWFVLLIDPFEWHAAEWQQASYLEITRTMLGADAHSLFGRIALALAKRRLIPSHFLLMVQFGRTTAMAAQESNYDLFLYILEKSFPAEAALLFSFLIGIFCLFFKKKDSQFRRALFFSIIGLGFLGLSLISKKKIAMRYLLPHMILGYFFLVFFLESVDFSNFKVRRIWMIGLGFFLLIQFGMIWSWNSNFISQANPLFSSSSEGDRKFYVMEEGGQEIDLVKKALAKFPEPSELVTSAYAERNFEPRDFPHFNKCNDSISYHVGTTFFQFMKPWDHVLKFFLVNQSIYKPERVGKTGYIFNLPCKAWVSRWKTVDQLGPLVDSKLPLKSSDHASGVLIKCPQQTSLPFIRYLCEGDKACADPNYLAAGFYSYQGKATFGDRPYVLTLIPLLKGAAFIQLESETSSQCTAMLY